jgi:hypothetical protein
MVQYAYSKHIGLIDAFQNTIEKTFPACNGVTVAPDEVTVEFPDVLSEQDQISLSNLVSSYVDPSYWLSLDHTENMPMYTSQHSNLDMEDIISFITSPSEHDDNDIVLGDMKTIVQLIPNSNLISYIGSSNWNNDPIAVTLAISNYTNNTFITSNSVNFNNTIDTQWIPLIQAGSNNLPAIVKTIQLYGLKDHKPSFDNIWQIAGSCTNSNIKYRLQSLQKIFYEVRLPQ